MKSCPNCKRTFDDTMTFCLVDGSILSAPFDPQDSEHLPSPRNSDPARTEILYPAPNTANARPPEVDKELIPPLQTIRSPASEPSLQETTASPVAQEYSSVEGITSQTAMKTMKAAPPEVMIGHNQRASSAAETFPARQLPPTQTTGGKRLATIAGGLLLVMMIGGIAWLIYEKVRKNSPVTKKSQQLQQNENKAQLTGQPFTENINGVQLQMVYVPGGTFLIGSPLSESGRDKDEGPQTDATVPSFYMSKYEVTQSQYQAVIGTNPSSFKGDSLPVDSVSWNDAGEFCRKLSRTTGREYRLPTEAEWEFASRAGTTGPYAGKIDALAWYSANSGSQTHPVGQKQPNGLGLYDMNGNVWEWCQSKYEPYPYNASDGREDLQGTDVRVMRGGSWESSANSCRSAYRRRVIPDLRSVGFRIILGAR